MLKKRTKTTTSKKKTIKSKSKKIKISAAPVPKKKKKIVPKISLKKKTIPKNKKKKIGKEVLNKTKTPKKIPKVKIRKKFRRIEAICLLTGIKKRFVYKKAQLLAAKYNFTTVEIFKENFLSREACTLLKQGFSEDEIKQKFNFVNEKSLSFDIIKRYVKSFNYREKMLRKRKRKIVNDIIDIQNSNNKIVAEYNPVVLDLKNPEHVAYLTKDVCLRPDIHLDGDYSCNFCPHFELCACTRKHWNKKISKLNDKSNKKSKRI